ncbi:MAG: hypothetical protein Rubg2KO_24900 [Rubricoccaceae bacterium]
MDFLELLDYEPTPLFGSEPDVNAYVELHNLIAAAESIEHFSRDDLDRISRQRDVDLKVAFINRRVRLYQDILDGLLVDGDLDSKDRKTLSHIAHTLALTPSLLRDAHERAFGNAVTSSISDDCLDLEERLLLYKLQHMLGLDPAIADKAYGFLARERLLKTVARVLCDGKLSPDEAQEVETVRTDLSLELPERIQQMLDRAADRWAVQNPQLEPVHVHDALKEGEIAYYTSDGITWTDVVIHDVRRILEMVEEDEREKGRGTRHVRMPDAALDGDRQRGRLTITSHRLILLATGRGQQSVNLRSLDEVRLFANGVTARTGGGWHVFFDLGSKSQRVHWVLGQLVKSSVQPLAVVPRAPSRGARWRKVTPDEIRAAGLDATTGTNASLRVLDALDASPELWEESGRVRFSRENVVLDGSLREDIRLSTVATAVRRGALVWMPLGLAQGWLIEFREEDQADGFVRTIRERKPTR